MDSLFLLKTLTLGVIEGATELLPVSSTGHLILVSDLLRFHNEIGKTFAIIIQFSAILAVIWEYRVRLLGISISRLKNRNNKSLRFLLNIAVAFLPFAILGWLFHKVIKIYLFNPVTVSVVFIIGGILIFWAEKRTQYTRVFSVEDIDFKDALTLGWIQTLALIPGISRSGATIVGGLFMGLSRKTATEFSFFLAIPTVTAAMIYEIYQEWFLIRQTDLSMWVVGFISGFTSSLLCIRWLLRYISTHNFIIFAWYRIILGIIILFTAYTGGITWSLH